jgi:hypothetical protein
MQGFVTCWCFFSMLLFNVLLVGGYVWQELLLINMDYELA